MTIVSSLSRWRRRVARVTAALLVSLFGITWAPRASAFCGFYVAGANTSLYANATMVVLMREGTRTVLSMQNNYQGQTGDFALVIPVPVVLQQDMVKTLPREIFQRVDQLGAPRLVEYWETDPCQNNQRDFAGTALGGAAPQAAVSDASAAPAVVIEAKFTVGEYNILILSANDSSALATWLQTNQYNIPAGADAVLAPYVAAGMKFFVAKVDSTKVTFSGGQALLSPLRFYYDSPDFALPVRLGLLNSKGQQDLIVNILSPNQRYEVANYKNTTIPTNIRVRNEVRDNFAGFYEALFQATIAGQPPTVVTEYSWDAQSCDPCPIPPLSPDELATLGADVTRNLGTSAGADAGAGFPPPGLNYYDLSYTLTRLHYRYSKADLGTDLVFQAAPAIVGGRGIPDNMGNMDPTVQPSSINNFQGRYVILHPWEGLLSCSRPARGNWGGPPGTNPYGGGSPMTQGLSNGALSAGAPPQPANLSSLLAQNVPAIRVVASRPVDPLVGQNSRPSSSSCAASALSASDNWASGLAVAAALGIALVRRPVVRRLRRRQS